MARITQTPFSLPATRTTRITLYIVILLFVAIVGSFLSRTLQRETATSTAYNMKGRPVDTALFQFTRPAQAGTPDDERDPFADKVYGQPDFDTDLEPTSATSSTLFSPSDMTVYENTGQIFVADTDHNRVLGWNSVDVYENGDPADIVLGQPDFSSTDAPDPPDAFSMNAPSGITIGFDGFLYVSDTGNNRILIFVPCNDFYDFYFDENDDSVHDIYGCDPDDVAEPSTFDEPFPIFTSGMASFYALGQEDMNSGDVAATSPSTLDSPLGIVTDINDTLIVADAGNNRVLFYEWPLGTGEVARRALGQGPPDAQNTAFYTNLAPDPPTASSLNNPTDVAVNAQATELFVADSGNNRVLVYTEEPIDTRADRVIGQSDFVSNGIDGGTDSVSASGFDTPTGLEMDAGNRLFVADTGNHRVLAFDQLNPDGVADAVFGQADFESFDVGSGEGGVDSPTDIATDVFNMGIFIADAGNHRVLHYDQPLINPVPTIHELSPGTVRAGIDGFELTIRGTGIISDTVIEIDGVARDDSVSFLGIATVEITASEIAQAGVNPTVRLSNPAPGGGNSEVVELIVYTPTADDDSADSVLGQAGFTTDDGEYTMGADTLREPSGVVVDPNSGRVFVADRENGRIMSWASAEAQENGRAAEVVIGQPDFTNWELNRSATNNIASPVGMALDSQGNLYVANPQWDEIHIYEAPFENGELLRMSITLEGAATPLYNPLDVTLDSNDNLYVADALNHRVLFFESPLATGNTDPDAVFGQANFNDAQANQGGAATASTLNFPTSVALDAGGNLYVSDGANHRVLLFTAVNGTIDSTADVVFGQANFSDTQPNQGGAMSASTLNFPYGIELDSTGTLFVADMDNNRVLGYENPSGNQAADIVYGQDGSFTQSRAAAQRGQTTFDLPVDVSFSADNDLFVADSGNNRVLSFLRSQVPTAVDLQAQQTTSTPSATPLWLFAVTVLILSSVLLLPILHFFRKKSQA